MNDSKRSNRTPYKSLLFAMVPPVAVLVLIVRFYGIDATRLMADMRELRPLSVNAMGEQYSKPDAVAWHYERIQSDISAQRPFQSVLQMDKHSRDGGSYHVVAEYPVSDETVCMYVYVSRPLKDPATGPAIVEFVATANGASIAVPLDALDRPRLVTLRDVRASASGTVSVQLSLVSNGPGSRLPIRSTRVAADYLHFEACHE